MKKFSKIKRIFTILLIFLISIKSFAAIVSDNDGSAFITKAEFDSLKNNFQSQIDSYNTSIDSKIDGAIASYLAGIKITKDAYSIESCLGAHRDKKNNTGTILFVGTDATRWFYAGTAMFSTEAYKGKWNASPQLQSEVWWNTQYQKFWSPYVSGSVWPQEYMGAVDFAVHAKWLKNVYDKPSDLRAIHLLLDDNNHVQNFRANGRIVFSRLLDVGMQITATNWEPIAIPRYDDGTLCTLNLVKIDNEMFIGQNTHNNAHYINVSYFADDGISLRFPAARWGTSGSYPKFAEVLNPVTKIMQDLGYVESISGYGSAQTTYQYFKSSWNQSLNTQYGDGFGVYVPSGLKYDTCAYTCHDWPSTDLLEQVEKPTFRFGQSGNALNVNVPDYDSSAAGQSWICQAITCQQWLGGISAYIAGASRIYEDINIKGWFPDFKADRWKNMRDVSDAQIYDAFGEECPLAGCPLLYAPIDGSGTITWSNITFSNGIQNEGVTAGNFQILFNKNKFVTDDINASDQVVISTPKPFKYKTHSSSTWSSEVTSLQPTKGIGYDFQFEVEKNEKIYFGVFDKNNFKQQAIVVQEMDADAMMFQPALD